MYLFRFCKYLILFCSGSLFPALSLFAQGPDISKTKKLLQETKNDSLKVVYYDDLCEAYNGIHYDSSVYYGKKGLTIARKLKNAVLIENCLNSMAGVHFQAGKFPKSIQALLKCLKIAEENHHQTVIEQTLSNLAVVYHNIKDYDKALEYYKRVLAYTEQKPHNDATLSLQLSNIGMLYKDKGNFSLAMQTMEKSLEHARVSGDSSTLARALNNVAELYGIENQPEKSKRYYLMAYRIQEKLGNARGIFITSSNLAGVYNDNQKYDSALYFGNIALDKAKMFNGPHYYKTIYNVLASIYKHKNDHKKALEYYQLFEAYKDSIFNEENSRIISDLKTQYEVDKTTAELNARAAAEKEKAEAIRQEEERRSTMVVAFISGILLLVCVFSFFLYKRFALTKKQKQIIETQKIRVEEKNREITDSINYAQRLQNAILAKESEIKKVFPDFFLLYLPKDIVAGDFYFFDVTDTHAFYAAADCTGHGVPGAMVSVICSNALSQSINEFRITEPGKILDRAREIILETFKKSGEHVKDGMDISLLAKDLRTGHYTWAGANNSLFVYDALQDNTYEVKADKQPVGYTENPQPFITHALQLNKSDCVFMYTDGFHDQFGGEKGKKLKKINFYHELKAGAKEEPAEIKKRIHQVFNQWKGNHPQLDDVCVIGIKV